MCLPALQQTHRYHQSKHFEILDRRVWVFLSAAAAHINAFPHSIYAKNHIWIFGA
jgi:hypothetical protein